MTITGGFVLFVMTWFIVFLVILPLRIKTQADAHDVVPGTPRGAPHQEVVGRKALLTTLVAFVVWAVIAGVIISEVITVRDFDWMGRLPPLQEP